METPQKKFGQFAYRLYDVARTKAGAEKKREGLMQYFRYTPRIAKLPNGMYGVWVR